MIGLLNELTKYQLRASIACTHGCEVEFNPEFLTSARIDRRFYVYRLMHRLNLPDTYGSLLANIECPCVLPCIRSKTVGQLRVLVLCPHHVRCLFLTREVTVAEYDILDDIGREGLV
jgi:hypothetical protein